MSVPTVTLSNEVTIPAIGFGTWQLNTTNIKASLSAAIEAGYRLIDTSRSFGNEEMIGEAISELIQKKKIKREDLFITTKLPIYAHRNEITDNVIDLSLKALGTPYIDQYLIELPCAVQGDISGSLMDKNGIPIPDLAPQTETWKVLEDAYKSGKVKSIGLANFNEWQIQALYTTADVKPQILEVECHILLQQPELLAFCKKNNITVMASAPLGSPQRSSSDWKTNWPEGNVLGHPVVLDMAGKHRKTAAQICLRALHQLGAIPLPSSTNKSHIKENIDIFGFKLSSQEMEQVKAANANIRLFVYDL
ncbi:unnamed protein product [Bursaphelenchus okinawaensis]|uniref:NADP-dependent oxidoreductase domain-containing protein n=1 Tax=Bursaphelenchus okinawaensis TaxID=465554 RepID=A0A811L9J2_9BILA|nr:unnamed protein product [Bursaphelenchus okinawaensis]CAG9119834.1 unnamed protein product [Bursaphelenchus okinawaensis]